MFHLVRRVVWLVLGLASGVLGIIGLMLPIVPQIPFILFGIYCLARFSKRFQHWINDRPLYAKYKQRLHHFIKKHEAKKTWYHRLIVWCCRPLVEI